MRPPVKESYQPNLRDRPKLSQDALDAIKAEREEEQKRREEETDEGADLLAQLRSVRA